MNYQLLGYPHGAIGARFIASTPQGTLIPATEAAFTPLDIFVPAGGTKDVLLWALWIHPLSVATITGIRYQMSLVTTSAAGTGGTALVSVPVHRGFTDSITGLRCSQWAAAATSPTIVATLATSLIPNDEQDNGPNSGMALNNNSPGCLPCAPITLRPGEGVAIHSPADSGIAAGLWAVCVVYEIRRQGARGTLR